MSRVEILDYDKMEKAIDTVGSLEKDIEIIFDNIYKLQEDFKKNHGGTYFETEFITKDVMESYVSELNANKRWLQNYYKEMKETDALNMKKANDLNKNVSDQKDNIDNSNSNNNFSDTSSSEIRKKISDIFQPGYIDVDDYETRNKSGGVPSNAKAKIKNQLSSTTLRDKLISGLKQEDIIDEEKNSSEINAENITINNIDTKSVTQEDVINETPVDTVQENNIITPTEFLNSANDYHSKLVNDKGWKWSSAGLFYYDIKKSTYHPKKLTCCATYVASILYLSGLFTENEINNKKGWNYNHPEGIKELCQSKNWTKITNVKDVKAGDIVFYWGGGKEYGRTTGHVMIYAGDGKWYNGGSTKSLQSAGPAYYGPPSGNFAFAYRMP